MRVDYSLRRLVHYTGTDWRTIQPWILFTNYQRYLDQFLAWSVEELVRPDGVYTRLALPGGAVVRRGESAEAMAATIAAAFEQYRGKLVPESGAFRETADGIAAELEKGAGAIIALSENHADMKPGDFGLLCAFGAGYSIGGALLKMH